MQVLKNPLWLWLACGLMLMACGGGEPTVSPTLAPTSSVIEPTPGPPPTPVPLPTVAPGVLAPRSPLSDTTPTSPLLLAHLAQVEAALQAPIPILPLPDLDEAQRQAQTLAMADPTFQANIRHPQTGEALRNEIFGVYPLRPGDISAALAVCEQATCYRVDLYNYALNLSTHAMVNLDTETVLAVNTLPDTQPDIPAHLIEIALEIATTAPEVAEAWGEQPGPGDATMENVKSALNQSRCERSRHLCVAPTFVKGEWALWAIVDLTDGSLVGLRWTNTGRANPMITEKSLQNDVVMAEYCDQLLTLARDQWSFDYTLTSSDGLRITNLRFAEQPVVDSIKLVDWHVSYSEREGFGYSDAIGCPIFSQASIVAFNGPRVEEIRATDGVPGFALIQEYQSDTWPAPCNYFYSQRFEFYTDGRFRVVFANHGRGCGNDGIYRPVLRIAWPGTQTFAAWDGDNEQWVEWGHEQWQAPFEPTTPEGYQFRVTSETGHGYHLMPGRGQFGDGGRGDQPYLYVTRRHLEPGANDEGETDLITIGPCCNQDHRQGPEKFIDPEPEPISASPLVVWYVAQIYNDDTPGEEYCWAEATLVDGVFVPEVYPCYGGPMFVPFASTAE